jgi:hypothetical protein
MPSTHPTAKSSSIRGSASQNNHLTSAMDISTNIEVIWFIGISNESYLPMEEVPTINFEAPLGTIDECRVVCHRLHPIANHFSFLPNLPNLLFSLCNSC